MSVKILRNFDPTTGASKTRLCKSFAKFELVNVKINSKYWITEIKIVRGNAPKLNASKTIKVGFSKNKKIKKTRSS